MPFLGAVSKPNYLRGFLALLISGLMLAVSMTPLGSSPSASAANLDVAGKAFSFKQTNRTLSSSPSPTSAGGYSIYTNVTSVDGIDIDAKITTESISQATISDYDADGSASNNLEAFQVNQDITSVGGVVTYKFEFFDHSTSQPVVLENVSITSIDLDGGGRQFAEFSSFQSYKRSTATDIVAYTTDASDQPLTGGLVRFAQERPNNASSTNNLPSTAVQVDFAQLSSFKVSFGNEADTGTAFFGLTFKTLCSYATGGSSCATGAAVNNPNNSAPTTQDTNLNYLNDGTTWTAIPKANFPYADSDSNPFAFVEITTLPATGTLERFVNGGWTTVSAGNTIDANDIASGYLRYKGPVDASFTFKVNDGLTYSTVKTVTLAGRPTAQAITFNQPNNKSVDFTDFASGATADSGLTVILTSETTSVCAVSSLNIIKVTGAAGTCTITASQPGSMSAPLTFAAAVPVTRSFQVSNKASQTITLANPGDQTYSGSNINLTPAVGLDVTAQRPVTVVSLTSSVCTVSYTSPNATAAVVVLGVGNCQLRATSAGNVTYADANPVVVSFNIASNGSPSYTVTFDGNNATSGSMSAQTASTSTALTANAFALNGYTFGGWSTTQNGSVAYANNATYPFAASATLYAIWTANTPAPTVAPAIPAAPVASVPSGSTVGITPVTLTPAINAPGGIGSKCLVDPADNVCKQTVTLPGKGTFVLNSNGTVTFTAVLGWVGTATVQFKVTDTYGQSTQTPVTVIVTAPAAATITGGSGTTTTTVPANVTPQVSGLGSICLIDPADNVCKQTVTIPGKGTFVLNANGTVTFTAAAGFIGTVTVQLQITDAYGQSARGPITFIVGQTSQLQTGATTGTAPVILAPNTKPEAGSACLVDPNDSECKSVVSIPQVGTWNLNTSNGSVSFKAVEGYVGTTIVQYRIKRAGFNPTETPFVVTVAKKRPPVTITIGGFNPGSPILTSSIKTQIAAFMKAYVGYRTIECIGFTMGPTVLKVDKWLSTTRATNGCDYVLKTLKSKVKALPLRNKMETVLGSQIRRITLTLRD